MLNAFFCLASCFLMCFIFVADVNRGTRKIPVREHAGFGAHLGAGAAFKTCRGSMLGPRVFPFWGSVTGATSSPAPWLCWKCSRQALPAHHEAHSWFSPGVGGIIEAHIPCFFHSAPTLVAVALFFTMECIFTEDFSCFF